MIFFNKKGLGQLEVVLLAGNKQHIDTSNGAYTDVIQRYDQLLYQ